jgi:anthranilate synthase component 1
LQSAFDITGDLDTPVSAFMKLAAFGPRFLLESVEGGERLARYSFIGFGEGLEVRLDAAGFLIDGQRHAPPANAAELLAQLRAALAAAPRPQPEIPGVPLAGGLVGFAAYDVVRHFERLTARRACGRAGAALRRAALHAGVRSPDARHRAAACRLGK